MFSLPTITALAALTGVAFLATLSAPAQDADSYRVATTGAAATDLMAGDPEVWSSAAAVAWGEQPWPTEFRALRDSESLWLRFDATDDAPWYRYTQRDDKLWEEEVVEIFIDPDGDGRNYIEIEVNPANVICDLMITAAQPQLDGDLSWDFPGIETAVLIHRNEAGATTGWITIVRLPWTGFAAVPDTEMNLPPEPQDQWRFNVFRIKRPGGPESPADPVVLEAWSPVPGNSFHVPEVFRPMEFE